MLDSPGERLAIALKQINISNKQLAEIFNTSPQNISNLKSNQKLNDLMAKISNKYHINLNWLMSGEGEPFLHQKNNTKNIQGDNVENFKNGIGILKENDKSHLELQDTFYKLENLAKMGAGIDFLKTELEKIKQELIKYV